jgi:hypothetical protein
MTSRSASAWLARPFLSLYFRAAPGASAGTMSLVRGPALGNVVEVVCVAPNTPGRGLLSHDNVPLPAAEHQRLLHLGASAAGGGGGVGGGASGHRPTPWPWHVLLAADLVWLRNKSQGHAGGAGISAPMVPILVVQRLVVLRAAGLMCA